MKDLEYKGEKHEQLTDSDVARLSEALLGNNKFTGKLSLKGNGLTDLSALYLSRVFSKSFSNIEKLDLKGNAFSSKAGEYLG